MAFQYPTRHALVVAGFIFITSAGIASANRALPLVFPPMGLTVMGLEPPPPPEPRGPVLIPPPPEPRRPVLTRSAEEHLTAAEQDRLLFDVLSQTRVLEAWEREPRQCFLGRLRAPPADDKRNSS